MTIGGRSQPRRHCAIIMTRSGKKRFSILILGRGHLSKLLRWLKHTVDGFIAKIGLAGHEDDLGRSNFTILGCEAEELSNENSLCDEVFPGNPPRPPFRIMFTASMPCNVRHAVMSEPYPLASHVRFFTVRWSCSTTLLRYLH